MIVFFLVIVAIGICLVLLDILAAAADPTPSLYPWKVASTGGLLIGVGGFGALCAWIFG